MPRTRKQARFLVNPDLRGSIPSYALVPRIARLANALESYGAAATSSEPQPAELVRAERELHAAAYDLAELAADRCYILEDRKCAVCDHLHSAHALFPRQACEVEGCACSRFAPPF